MEQLVKVGVGLIILNANNQVLMGLRTGDGYGSGLWGFVGGKMEFGESFEQTAVRECFEETGIKLLPEQIKVLDVTNDFDGISHYVTIFTVARVHKATACVIEPDKCLKWEWKDINKLPDNLLLPIINFQKKYDIAHLIGKITDVTNDSK